MGETCLPDELRTLFLFEKLDDEQLQTLCENGHIAVFEPGPVCIEGDPATCFYVMLDGELIMSKRSGGVDVVNQPNLSAWRVLRRVVCLRPQRGSHLRGVSTGDQAVPVLRSRRERLRSVHEIRVPDGRASA